LEPLAPSGGFAERDGIDNENRGPKRARNQKRPAGYQPVCAVEGKEGGELIAEGSPRAMPWRAFAWELIVFPPTGDILVLPFSLPGNGIACVDSADRPDEMLRFSSSHRRPGTLADPLCPTDMV
jgi:hypothetical protein